MPIPPLTLAIVDDHALFRKILKNYLVGQHDLRVAVQASDMIDLMEQLKVSAVDLLLMDLFMPGLHGSEAVKVIRSEYPELKILILSMSDDVNLISDLLDSGIHGYIPKSNDPEELIMAIRTVCENRIFRNGPFTEALYWKVQNERQTYNPESSFTLSDREKKIIMLIWEEKSNKEIADQLFLGVRSVEKIRQDLKEKIGVKSTVGLLKYAITNKIVDMGPTPLPFTFGKNRNKN